MALKIPPHIAWPAFIVLLFVFGTVSTLSMVWIAGSDGGAQVIDNYYNKAVDWDRTAAIRDASEALGWRMAVNLERTEAASTRQLVLEIRDSEGQAVSGLSGTIRLYRPEVAGWLAELALVEDPGLPGYYRQEMPFGRLGLWAVELEASRGSTHYWQKVRTEIR